MSVSRSLEQLARSYQVATSYIDQAGITKKIGKKTLVAVLAAMGVDASTSTACEKSLKAQEDQQWTRVVDPTIVLTRSQVRDDHIFHIYLPVDSQTSVWIDLEDGGRRHDVRVDFKDADIRTIGRQRIAKRRCYLPKDLPLGWHKLTVGAGGDTSAESRRSATLIVTPNRLDTSDPFMNRPAWGLAAQLYTLRSRESWGLGDLADLTEIATWSAVKAGGDFVLVNPLHAAAPVAPIDPSPYLPVTRRFQNPIYLRPEAILEYEYLSAANKAELEQMAKESRERDLTSDLLDRDLVWEAKLAALELIHEVPLSPARQALFERYAYQENPGLRDFASWVALAEEYGAAWDEWPTELQDQHSPEVEKELDRLQPRVQFHMWVQWVLDQQMSEAQSAAKHGGMRVGIMHDLAVGVHCYGSDTWIYGDVVARGITVGAPPDSFNQVGQNWNQPPPRPDMLEQTGYAMFRDMLRTLLRNSGGLRIDHILGMFRLWWIPEGEKASEGTYVSYNYQALINILVLEAQRAGAVIVGEDLGTVEPWVREVLANKGILGTNILWFERDGDQPVHPSNWRRNAMTAVTVHDLPPTLGYLAGTHVQLRNDLGLLTSSLEEEQEVHSREIAAWRSLLESEALIPPDASNQEILVALHRFAARSRSALMAVAVPDLVGQVETQNQPGTKDEYPNWRIPLLDSEGEPVLIEQLDEQPLTGRILSALGASGRARW